MLSKKITKFLLAFFVLIAIAISVLYFYGFFRPSMAGILIETDPVSKVYIDGQYLGLTPYDEVQKPGEIFVKVEAEVDGIRRSFETKIYLVSGVKTVIKRNFAQDEDHASGVVVSFEKTKNKDAELVVVTTPDASQIILDDRIYGSTPLKVKTTPGEHNLIISSQKYLNQSLPIKTYPGYLLTAVVKLGIDSLEGNQMVLSSVAEKKQEIEVLSTGVGFLRVRSEPNSNSEILGQVNEGEIYEFEEEKNGWYRIKAQVHAFEEQTKEIEGWVSGEFTEKIEED